MSGPKLMELRRLRREARRQANADRCAELDSAYSRVYAAFSVVVARLDSLQDPLDFALTPPDQAAQEARAELAAGQDESAAARYDRRWRFAKDSLEQARLRLANRLLSLRLRCDLHARDREELRLRRARAESRLRADGQVGNNSSELASAPQPSTLNEEDVEGLERAEAALQQERAEVEALEAAAAQAPLSPIAQVPVTGRSLADWLGAESTRKGGDGSLPDSMVRILDQLKSASDPLLWSEWQQRAASIVRIQDPEERIALEHGFIVDGQARLRELKIEEACRARVEACLDRAGVFPGLSQHPCVLRLSALTLFGADEADPLIVELDKAIDLARETREREDRRRAVLESLKELGYEVQAELQTGHVSEGRLVFHKPPDTEYAVEVVSDAGSQRFQTAMVRYAAEEAMSDQQRLRDQEREQAWCGDHARLRERLRERGWEVDLRMQHAPGRHPVRVIVDPRCAATKSSRQTIPVVRRRSQPEAPE